ncbi:McrC family protein [Motilimonas pumila]|uniref:Restriction endonuclease n=1 Tax=Motilimonas pumila TaxID=2303987 RepID=A0A418YA47_9GAMM|nr:McrC family protein [Motilimonas pumila]RJG38793.1 restriction endonuclease [Motilimonas pumila]
MHTTVFEFGYLTFDKSASDEPGVKLISPEAFEYLKEVSLSETEMSMCLALTKRYGHELIQLQNYVGVLFTPTGEHVEVLPKTGRRSKEEQSDLENARQILLTMLQHLGSFRFLTFKQASVANKKMPLFEVFIEQFLQSVKKLVKQGLKSDYVLRQDNLSFQKGKLKVAAQIRRNRVTKHKFYVEYDEYLVDRPANRLIKSALKKLSSYTKLATNQKLLRELLFAFADVPLSKVIQQDFTALKLDRGMADYHPPLAWAKLILSGQSPLSMKGQTEAMSLLFPMEMVFENYVASILRSQLDDQVELSTQARSKYLLRHNGKGAFQLKPDLLITQGKQHAIVLDTKWKLIDLEAHNYGISQADMYQMYAYGQKYLAGKGELYLIYPSHDGFMAPIEHSFDFSDGLKLWVVPFTTSPVGNSRLLINEGHYLHTMTQIS